MSNGQMALTAVLATSKQAFSIKLCLAPGCSFQMGGSTGKMEIQDPNCRQLMRIADRFQQGF
jgi:hypothetical protein